MIKKIEEFPFYVWKIIIFFFTSQKSNSRHKHAKWPPSDFTPWTLTLSANYVCNASAIYSENAGPENAYSKHSVQIF